MNRSAIAALCALLFLPSLAAAQVVTPHVPAPPAIEAQTDANRVTFGHDAFVAAGETVRDVITMGGDAEVVGHVLGSVVTMGGDVRVSGDVQGDVVTMGGDVEVEPGGSIGGEIVTMGGETSFEGGRSGGLQVSFDEHGPQVTARADTDGGGFAGWLATTLKSALSYGLLFVLGLLFLGLAPDRLGALQSVMIREPLRAGATGALGVLGGALAIVVFAITIIGIPAAVVLALALPVAVYLGLAAAATVVGAALPVARLSGRPVLQLGAGVLALFVASLIPYVGFAAVAVAAVLGLGAMILTRLRKVPPESLRAAGPYRTPV